MRIRTKICGIRSLEDALQAVEAGADALGFVFYLPSPRYIAPEKAASICKQLPPFVSKVGLFVNESPETIKEICSLVNLDLLQFHGDEEESECSSYSLPYIKAIRVRQENDLSHAENKYFGALAILADAFKKGVPGGTGEAFDWSLLPNKRLKPLILAGGLNEKNIYQAIQTVHPYAVDVSGGVEQEKGIKNHRTVTQFLNEVSRASE